MQNTSNAAAQINAHAELREQILDLSRQNQIGAWSEFSPFNDMLDKLIEDGTFPATFKLDMLNAKIIHDLAAYRTEAGVSTVVIGMSGGVDSALTAAMFKKAGWRVIGVTMPIDQVQAETDRGVEACEALDIQHRHIDLTDSYNAMLKTQFELDGGIYFDNISSSIRRGNVRARLRMITLYNLASMNGGLVASTDNLSELTAGFWTLHGDVGDLSPIQSLTKSWEVPYLARLNGVPESTVRATPTDGLGISNGDEAQLGCSYLEWDILFFSIREALTRMGGDRPSDREILEEVGVDALIYPQFEAFMRRMRGSWFKRRNPLNIQHAFQGRFDMVEQIDERMFVPETFRS